MPLASIRVQLKKIWYLFPLFLLATARIWSQTATTTTLKSSATTFAGPGAVTLTATVTSSGAPVTPGLVKFCNASATSCQGLAVLGQAQLTASGVANYVALLSPGTHSVKAVFVGTTAAATSTSAALTITVTGRMPTTSSIAASTASPYTLTATVAGSGRSAVTGSVTFEDGTNGNLPLGTASLGTSTTALGFTPNTLTGAGSEPIAMAVGDFNGDGVPDIVVGDVNANSSGTYMLNIYLSNGIGTYQAPVAFNLPTSFQNPSALAVGDFNHDGALDLAVAGSNAGAVLILLGEGNGSFIIGGTFDTGTGPNSIAVGDFNGDGNADLAVSNQFSASVTILLGDGTGNFNPVAATPATGSFPYSIAAGDFNGDGKQDLAVANYFGNDVTVLLGNGDGTFTPTATSPATGVYADWVAVGDFNGDGKQDLAVTNQFSKTVTILLGDGKGNFTATSTSPATGNNPQSVAVGDFNGDGIEDLVVANTTDNTATIFLGKGDGSFPTTQLVAFPSGTSPYAAIAADFNGDGMEDFVVTGSGTNTVMLTLNSTKTTAQATATNVMVPGSGPHAIFASYPGSSSYGSSNSAYAVVTANPVATTTSLSVSPSGTLGVGETVQLIATVSPSSVGGLEPTGYIYYYSGSSQIGAVEIFPGQATEYDYTLTATGTQSLTARYGGDTNFLGSAASTPVTINPINPTASTTTLTLSSASVAKGTILTMTANVASGGKPVALGTVKFGYCRVGFCETTDPLYLAAVQLNPKGTAVFKGTLPVGSYDVYAFFIGTNDVTASSTELQPLAVTGTLSSTTTLAASANPGGSYTLSANVQGDWPPPTGTVSIVDTSNKNLLLSTGPLYAANSVLTPSSPISVGASPEAIAVGDFNGDGRPDLVVGNFLANSISVFLNNGSGSFTAVTSPLPSTVKLNGPSDIAVADFNGDGILDLAVTNYNSATVTILLGSGNGTFTLKSVHPTGQNPTQVLAADFNGDGKLDIATISYNGGTLVSYLGNGDGTFTQEPQTGQFGTGVYGMVTADFNDDGNQIWRSAIS